MVHWIEVTTIKGTTIVIEFPPGYLQTANMIMRKLNPIIIIIIIIIIEPPYQ